MNKYSPLNDPISAIKRKQVAQRRVGQSAKCSCGEARPEALMVGSKPIICAHCKRELDVKTTVDKHHFAGKSNSPITVQIPVNDHRAELSTAQMDWPKKTLENSDRSPALAAAAALRGFIDTVLHLIEKGVLWIADMLEKIDSFLVEHHGPQWWVNTPLESFSPRSKSNVRA